MLKLSEQNETFFFEFLLNQRSVEEFEEFVYISNNLEYEIGDALYLELIGLNYTDSKNVSIKLVQTIREQIIHVGRFESFKLKNTLQLFLTDIINIHLHLENLYHLYCGIEQENGTRKYEYKFLAHLGLNYFYWVDKGYVKTIYDENWEQKYHQMFNDFSFYHQQLKPFALLILNALNNNEIKISDDGTYIIPKALKEKLETKEIYKLQHP